MIHKIEFQLVGKRNYVRGTDVLRSVRALFPENELILKFTRPLEGSALMAPEKRKDTCVVIISGGKKLYLSNDPDAPILKRRQENAGSKWAFADRLGTLFIFTFWGRLSLDEQLEKFFTIVHPKLDYRFVIRKMHLFGNPQSAGFLLWFRLKIHRSRKTARIVIRNLSGPIGTVDFLLRNRE